MDKPQEKTYSLELTHWQLLCIEAALEHFAAEHNYKVNPMNLESLLQEVRGAWLDDLPMSIGGKKA